MSLTRRAALLALLPLPALAQPEGRGQGGGHGNPHRGGNQGRDGAAGPSLGTAELNTVQAWLGANPGFSAQPLPPRMQNRLARGKPLPPASPGAACRPT